MPILRLWYFIVNKNFILSIIAANNKLEHKLVLMVALTKLIFISKASFYSDTRRLILDFPLFAGEKSPIFLVLTKTNEATLFAYITVTIIKYILLCFQARESGTLHKYQLPQLDLVQRYAVACEPRILALNSNSS